MGARAPPVPTPMIYSMGDKAGDTFDSFKLEEYQSKSYAVVKAKFGSFFVKKKNIIYERAKFNHRIQEEGESVSSFISDLYSLAEHCGYGNLREELIRDRLVVSIRDARLSERLQLDSDLTLEKAVTSIRQSEMIHQQQSLLRGEEARQFPIDAVNPSVMDYLVILYVPGIVFCLIYIYGFVFSYS